MHTLNATLTVSNSSWLWRAFPKSVDRRLSGKVKLSVMLFIQRSAKPALLSCEIQFFIWRIQSSGFARSEPSNTQLFLMDGGIGISGFAVSAIF